MFCCDDMETHVENGEIAVRYFARFREYGIGYVDDPDTVVLITHCPWCGEELPESLRDEWYEAIDELRLEPDAEDEIPPEFLCDDWWLNRDL